MTADPNLLTDALPEWRPGVRLLAVGAAAGAERLGATAYELGPGAQAAPYHLHHGQEELLVVLSGTPELRTPAGTRRLVAGAVVAFPAGPDGAHRLRNDADEPCRYLVVGTTALPEVVEYPDTGTVLALTGPAAGHAWRAGSDVAYAEAVGEALAAEAR
ncbi:cupin domain-containing protein [Patulibacter sp. SYSU D01012]|uniref:cupin domain-containing protein n=1 Tax=Patulibacter sp. SYSU D01012 TaxID=2817381 RepID=UPI001B3157DC|nr:cupin domain-containing protein [Patulibacter sp. SYSU D01012]